VLWQAFRDHGASLNNALNVALRIHAGPAWQIFKVRVFFRFWRPPPRLFRVRASPDSVSLLSRPPVTGVGGSGPGEVRPPRPLELRVQLVPGPV
jgi:hypothetical protein